jgi:hypothetical protein
MFSFWAIPGEYHVQNIPREPLYGFGLSLNVTSRGDGQPHVHTALADVQRRVRIEPVVLPPPVRTALGALQQLFRIELCVLLQVYS